MYTKMLQGIDLKSANIDVEIGPISISTRAGGCVPDLQYIDDDDTITLRLNAGDGYMEIYLNGNESKSVQTIELRFSDPIECHAVRTWFETVSRVIEKLH